MSVIGAPVQRGGATAQKKEQGCDDTPPPPLESQLPPRWQSAAPLSQVYFSYHFILQSIYTRGFQPFIPCDPSYRFRNARDPPQ